MTKSSKKKYELTDSQELYLQIYHEYFVLCLSQYKIAEKHDCTQQYVSKAIKWVNDNKLNIASNVLIEGAISSIRERLSGLKDSYETESKRSLKTRDSKMIIGLIKEIREDEKLLYKLQEIISEGTTEDSGMTASSVLKLIKEATKLE